MELEQFIRTEAERLASLCTQCGKCVAACPMVEYVPGADSTSYPQIAKGMVDILRGGEGDEASRSWVHVCTRSGSCTSACPENLDAAFMVRLANWRAMGGIGDKALNRHFDEKHHAQKVKAFSILTLTPEEEKSWTA